MKLNITTASYDDQVWLISTGARLPASWSHVSIAMKSVLRRSNFDCPSHRSLQDIKTILIELILYHFDQFGSNEIAEM